MEVSGRERAARVASQSCDVTDEGGVYGKVMKISEICVLARAGHFSLQNRVAEDHPHAAINTILK